MKRIAAERDPELGEVDVLFTRTETRGWPNGCGTARTAAPSGIRLTEQSIATLAQALRTPLEAGAGTSIT
ncbi:hypothetical protein [Streptomyces sp. A0592]|uniref:hypothetical protein n=1 Tax=Streptomyces sp. A0592 TaxID=2563099 RepID=UPI00109EC338|nr:hypothetical protein [Streptomyces sp. A0592]THA77973.1 hypothetical protein E6U81_33425 [Streptomyces sp. A0592]